jgi:hypothetical protein
MISIWSVIISLFKCYREEIIVLIRSVIYRIYAGWSYMRNIHW